MPDNELLLAISHMLDKKLKPVNDRLKKWNLFKKKTFFHDCKILKHVIRVHTSDTRQGLNKLKQGKPILTL